MAGNVPAAFGRNTSALRCAPSRMGTSTSVSTRTSSAPGAGSIFIAAVSPLPWSSIRQLDLHLVGDFLPIRQLGLVPCLRLFNRGAGQGPDHLLPEGRRHLLGTERLNGSFAHDLEHIARRSGRRI